MSTTYQKILLVIQACLLISLEANSLQATKQHPENGNEIFLGASMIPDLFHPEEPGIYNAIYDQLMIDIPFYVRRLDTPVRRVQQLFLRQRLDCQFVADKKSPFATDYGFDEDAVIYSDTVRQTRLNVYTLKENEIIETPLALENMVVAADAGTGMGRALYNSLPESTLVLPTDTIAKSIELIERGRAGAFVAYHIDVVMHFREFGQSIDDSQIAYSPTFSLHTSDDAFTCWNTEKNRSFLNAINTRLGELKATDTLITTETYSPR